MAGDWHLPFEPTDGELADKDDAILAGGFVVMGAVVEDPLQADTRHPALVFRFQMPGGDLHPPIVLVLDDLHMESAAELVVDAVARAREKARQ